ncbi:hypothetical protein FG131_19250 [Vibrio cholerae]|nr:hypothetical protein [Vibrio cholerae]MDN6976302.1 hypothetical protein [Vibrio cholerae]
MPGATREFQKHIAAIGAAIEEQLTVSDEMSSNLSSIKTLAGEMHIAIKQLVPVEVDLQRKVDDLNSAIASIRT